MPEFVHHASYKGIATISLHRPELHNAFNEVLIAELEAEFSQVAGDDAVRLVVLAGEGKSFCAGADLNWMRKMVDYSKEQNIADAAALAKMLRTIRDCPKPTIARVHGAVYGGGIGLVAACDMAVALEKATFCFSEVRLGIAPAVIAPFVMEKIGAGPLRRYALTAETFDAIEAEHLGLVSEVVSRPQDLDCWIQDVGDRVRANGPRAVAACKELLAKVAHTADADEATRTTAEAIAKLRVSEEGQEGLRAFLEKRKPCWKDASEEKC
jgi:methylglutaconyl-CoA hydratase